MPASWRTCSNVAIAVLVLAGGVARAGAQQPATRPACPDTSVEKACASYAALVQAGDDGVRMTVSRDGIGLVCFRQAEDAFFFVEIGGPANKWTRTHLDPNTNAQVPDEGATSPARGKMWAFKDGTQTSRETPIREIQGDWQVGAARTFRANKINGRQADTASGVVVSASRVDASLRYESVLGSRVDYRLVIQRATGRFSETYTAAPETVPFTNTQGRCIPVGR